MGLYSSKMAKLDLIIKAACDEWGVDAEGLCSKSREQNLCNARFAISYISIEDYEIDASMVADSINRDRTTVGYHQVHVCRDLMQTDPVFSEKVAKCRRRVVEFLAVKEYAVVAGVLSPIKYAAERVSTTPMVKFTYRSYATCLR